QDFKPRLVYPFLARGPGLLNFSQMPLGTRSVDFNEEGMTTVGQLPDLIADMEAIGLTPDELQPLFHSAEAYILMWERAEAAAKSVPRPMVVSVTGLQAASPTGVESAQTFTVQGKDLYFETAVQTGQVFINGQNVGTLRQPIGYTFQSRLVPQRCVII